MMFKIFSSPWHLTSASTWLLDQFAVQVPDPAGMLSGGILWAYIIGSVCGVVSNMDPHETAFRQARRLADGSRTAYRFSFLDLEVRITLQVMGQA